MKTMCMCVCVKEASGRESTEGLVTSEQQDDTPASTLYTDSHTKKQHLPRHIQYQQQQHTPAAVPTSQGLKNSVTCRVLMLDGVEYELSVEVYCTTFVIHILFRFLSFFVRTTQFVLLFRIKFTVYTVSRKKVDPYINCYNSTKTCQIFMKFYTCEPLNMTMKMHISVYENIGQRQIY